MMTTAYRTCLRIGCTGHMSIMYSGRRWWKCELCGYAWYQRYGAAGSIPARRVE